MIITILVLSIFAVLSVGCVLVMIGTFRKTKWGINTARVICPKCGITMGRVRTPKTMAQALWGGATCQTCGIEVDEWGRQHLDTSL